MGCSMTAKKAHKKPTTTRQEPLFGPKREERLEPIHVETSLSPIVDKRSYDHFIKVISLRIYVEFEKTMKDAGLEKPELSLVGFDLKKAVSATDLRMADYIALNARLIQERAFVDQSDFASRYMPRVMRQMAEEGAGDIGGYIEGKVQHDIMMEIRAIAMQHIPEGERYSYRNTLKVL